jgi:hypothetical protein
MFLAQAKFMLISKPTICLVLFWLFGSATGLFFLTKYSFTSRDHSTPPLSWPAASGIPFTKGKKALLVFIHPHCSCSRATLGSLAEIMARAPATVRAVAVFLRPKTETDKWTTTDLWKTANRIPRVSTIMDKNGAEAAIFDAQTSGQTLLYDDNGKLIFSGGITSARGHYGDNPGSVSIRNALHNCNGKKQNATVVFGCPLFAQRMKEENR